MRKKLVVLGICIFVMAGLAACGSDSDISYEDYDLNEYLEVGEYKGLEIEDYTVSVTEDEIEAEIQNKLEAAAETKEIDKKTALKDGDTANIDYVGKIDGKEFEGGSAEGYDLTLGSGSFIEGFESGLVGKKVGDKVELELTFPKDYSSEELQGKDVVFSVTVNSATEKIVPEYDLEFVKETTDYKTLKEYEDFIEQTLYDSKEVEAIANQQTELWSMALENTEVKKYPERELEIYMQLNSDQIDAMAESYGMTREEMFENYGFGDEKEFAAVNEDSTKLRIKQEMLIEYITEKENLEATEEEINVMIEQFEASGYTEELIESQTGRTMEDYTRVEVLYQKVLGFLQENAVITK